MWPELTRGILKQRGLTRSDVERFAPPRPTALVAALSFCVDDGQTLPQPSRARGRPVARVPALVAPKLALHGAMLDEGVSNVMLAARLGVDEKAVRRLRDPMHRSHIATIEAALRTLGKQIEVTIAEAA